MSDDAAIRTSGLTKRFGSIVAVDGLDMTVPAGSIFGLLGPNGAGKTTTIRILVGLARPTGGTAMVLGKDATTNATELHHEIGYIDQDPRFYGWMTGRELLELVGRLQGLNQPGLTERVTDTLEQAGLSTAADRRIGVYSGGMRQRLGIAQAILHRPRLLILDEPVSSLDPEGRRDILAFVASLRGSTTVVLSTHVLEDVERVCDHVAVLDRGRLVTAQPLSDLLAAHARPIYVLDPEPGQDGSIDTLVERLRTAPWSRDVQLDGTRIRVMVADPDAAAREILPIVVESGVALAQFERARPTLEDVFVELVGRPNAMDLDGRGFVRPREKGR